MSVKIDQALVKHFIDQDFDLPIAHENENYSPVQGAPYVEVRVFQNQILPIDLKHGSDTTGLFQFILRHPENTGAIPAKTKADAIMAAFPIGARLAYDGQRVTITGQERSDAVPEDGWFKITGRIYYRAFIAR